MILTFSTTYNEMNDTPILANIVATSTSTSTLISSTSTVNVLRTKRSKNQKYFWNSLMHITGTLIQLP